MNLTVVTFIYAAIMCSHAILSIVLGVVQSYDKGYITGGYYMAYGMVCLIFGILYMTKIHINRFFTGIYRYLICVIGICVDISFILVITNVIREVPIYKSVVGEKIVKCILYNYSCQSHVRIFEMKVCNYISPAAIGSNYFYYVSIIVGVAIHGILSIVCMFIPMSRLNNSRDSDGGLGKVNPITDVYDSYQYVNSPTMGNSRSPNTSPGGSPRYHHKELDEPKRNTNPERYQRQGKETMDKFKSTGTHEDSYEHNEEPASHFTTPNIPRTNIPKMYDVDLNNSDEHMPNKNLKLFSPL